MFERLISLTGALMLAFPTLASAAQSANEHPIQGWWLRGDAPSNYSCGVESGTVHDGHKVAFVKFEQFKDKPADDPTGFGTLMQMFKATNYTGKRVRLSGFVKSKDIAIHSGLWMRIDGVGGKSVGFDNMRKRSILGTTDWKKYDVVLDVPSGAEEIALGAIISGEGEIWISGLSFEVVDKSVPTTAEQQPSGNIVEPTNLDFDAK